MTTAPDATRARPVDLCLEIDANKAYTIDQQGTLNFRLVQCGSDAVTVDLSLTCHCHEGNSKRKTVRLDPSTMPSRELRVPWRPQHPGEELVEVDIRASGARGENWRYVGEATVVVAGRSEATQANSIRIDIHDVEKLMGVDMSRLVNVTADGKVPSADLEALLRQHHGHEAWWKDVPLEIVEQPRQSGVTDLAADPGVHVRLASFDAVDDGEPFRARLCASLDGARFGRSLPPQNDLVLAWEPPDAERDGRISRRHFALVPGDGGVALQNGDGGNTATYVDGAFVQPGKTVGLGASAHVMLGLQILELEVRAWPRVESDGRGVALDAIRRFLPGSPELPVVPASCAVVTRLNNAADLRYCWLLTVATLGIDAVCPLRLAGDGVARLHVRLWALGGRYFGEVLAAPTRVDGVLYEPGTVLALGASHRLDIGSRHLAWSAS